MAWALAAGTKYILQIGSSSETTLKPHWRGQHSCCLLKALPFARSVSSVTLTLWVFVRVSSSRGRQKCYKVEHHLREQGQTISSFTTWVSVASNFLSPGGEIGFVEPSDWRSSRKCNTVANLCLSWNEVHTQYRTWDSSLQYLVSSSFVGRLSLMLCECIFIPLFLFPEFKLVLSHA